MFIPDLTDDQRQEALAEVLRLLGHYIERAQGTKQDPRKLVGCMVIGFYDDGDYSGNYAGQLQKGTTIGAIMDMLLTFRERGNNSATAEMLDALFTSSELEEDGKLN